MVITCRKCGIQFGSGNPTKEKARKKSKLCWQCDPEPYELNTLARAYCLTVASGNSPNFSYYGTQYRLCPHCYNATPLDSSFCISCGKQLAQTGITTKL